MLKKTSLICLTSLLLFSCNKQANNQNVIIGNPSGISDSPSTIKRAVNISTFPADNQLKAVLYDNYDPPSYYVKFLPIVKYNDGSTDSDVIWDIGEENSSGVSTSLEKDGLNGYLKLNAGEKKEMTSFILTLISKKSPDVRKSMAFCRRKGYIPFRCPDKDPK